MLAVDGVEKQKQSIISSGNIVNSNVNNNSIQKIDTPNCDIIRNKYNYYSIKHLVCILYQYIFSSNTKKFADLLDLVLGSFKHHEDTHGSYVFKEQDDILFNHLYKLVFYTRNTLNLFDLTYMQIIIWDKYYPEIAKNIITKLVFNEDSESESESDSVSGGYGGWRDIKYICYFYIKYHNIPIKYLVFNTLQSYYEKNYDLPSLIKHCLYLYKKQFCRDLEAIKSAHTISTLAKWIPREKSQPFGWIYRHLVVYLAEVMNSEKDYCFARKWLRKELSRLNRHLETVQINMCENKWEKIKVENITQETYRRNKLALLNLTPDNKIRYPSSIDRSSCALNINRFMISKYDSLFKFQPNEIIKNIGKQTTINALIDNVITRSTQEVENKLYETIESRIDCFSLIQKHILEQQFNRVMSNYIPEVVDNIILAIDVNSSYKFHSVNNYHSSNTTANNVDKFYTKDLPHVNTLNIAGRIIKSSSYFQGFITRNNTWEDCKNMTYLETINTILETAQSPHNKNNINVFDVIVYNFYTLLYNKIKNDNKLISQIRNKKINLSKYTILFLGDSSLYDFSSHSYLMSIIEAKYSELGELILPQTSGNTYRLLPPKLVFWDTTDGIQQRDATNNTIHFVKKINPYVSIINPRKFSCLYDQYKQVSNGYSNNNLAMKQWSETQRSLIETLFDYGINELLMFNHYTNFSQAISRTKYSELNVFV